ncbi:hypothetical protein MDA_GLEAN10004447 [Myotis davidii]|uniref:Uncharacterized protein n=1 Tax=Myotis davidii TaxID=225400 RepID=L5LZZ8_MYODS|nr:hypothetical protein MDA_GLEAN10004447 [Myotis davidii]
MQQGWELDRTKFPRRKIAKHPWHCNHVSSRLLSKEHQSRKQPAPGLRAAASCGLPLSKEQQLCERPTPPFEEQQPHEQPDLSEEQQLPSSLPTSEEQQPCAARPHLRSSSCAQPAPCMSRRSSSCASILPSSKQQQLHEQPAQSEEQQLCE